MKVASDGGLLAFRELDAALGLSVIAGDVLADTRTGSNGRHTVVAQFRQSVFGRLAGYEDVNDADRLAHDPTMRWVVGDGAVMGQAASASQMGRFETEAMTQATNLNALAGLSGQWIDLAHARRPLKIILLDMDSSVSPTFGESRRARPITGTSAAPVITRCSASTSSAIWSGVRCARATCTVPMVGGRCWSVVARYRDTMKRRYFRADAAFALPDVYIFLEAEGFGYAIRLPANAVLQRSIGHLLKRPVGRPPHEVRRYYASFSYRAASWDRPRPVVAKVEWHTGELYPRVGFLVTNLSRSSERVVAFYNGRGTAEQWIKEGKNAVK